MENRDNKVPTLLIEYAKWLELNRDFVQTVVPPEVSRALGCLMGQALNPHQVLSILPILETVAALLGVAVGLGVYLAETDKLSQPIPDLPPAFKAMDNAQ